MSGAGGPCLFCSIASGESPAAMVLEEDETLAFLDTRPVFHGHVLVVPRMHVATLPELQAELIAPLMTAVQRICRAVEKAVDAHGTFVAVNNVVSQSVPHLHFHVVPRRRKDGLRGFFWPRVPYDDAAQRDEVASRIRTALAD